MIALAIWLVLMSIGIACIPLVVVVERWASDILEQKTGDDE